MGVILVQQELQGITLSIDDDNYVNRRTLENVKRGLSDTVRKLQRAKQAANDRGITQVFGLSNCYRILLDVNLIINVNKFTPLSCD